MPKILREMARNKILNSHTSPAVTRTHSNKKSNAQKPEKTLKIIEDEWLRNNFKISEKRIIESIKKQNN